MSQRINVAPGNSSQCRERARTAERAAATRRAAAQRLPRLLPSDVRRPGRRPPKAAPPPPTPLASPRMGLRGDTLPPAACRHRPAAKSAQTAAAERNSLARPADNRRPRPNAAPTAAPNHPAQSPNLPRRRHTAASPGRAPPTQPRPPNRGRAAMAGVQTHLRRPTAFHRPRHAFAIRPRPVVPRASTPSRRQQPSNRTRRHHSPDKNGNSGNKNERRAGSHTRPQSATRENKSQESEIGWRRRQAAKPNPTSQA